MEGGGRERESSSPAMQLSRTGLIDVTPGLENVRTPVLMQFFHVLYTLYLCVVVFISFTVSPVTVINQEILVLTDFLPNISLYLKFM